MRALRGWMLVMLLASVLVGCGRVDEDAPEIDSATTTAVTITGTAATVDVASQRVELDVPVEGVEVVTLSEDAEVVGADGSPTTLEGLQPGVTIEAMGWVDDPSVLLARRVRLLGAAPPPSEAGSPPVAVGDVVLEAPVAGAVIESPLEVRGRVAETPPDATVRVRLYDVQSRVLAEQFLRVTGEEGQPGTFAAQVPFPDAPVGGTGRVEAVVLGAGGETTPAGAVARVTFGGTPGDTPEVTITAQVLNLVPASGVIMLAEPVEGFNSVALLERTVIHGPSGGTLSLTDIPEGATIEVAGRPAPLNVLHAWEIWVQ